MKTIFKKLFYVFVLMFAPVVSFAQAGSSGGSASSFVSHIGSEISGMEESVKIAVLAVIGMIALVYAAINLVKYLRGDGQSQNAIIRVVVGVAMALVVVALAAFI